MFNQETERISAPQDFFCGSAPEGADQLPSLFLEAEKRKEPLYKTLSAPISAQIELTEACNLSCRHCYNFWRQESFSQSSTLTGDRLFRVLEEFKNNRVFRVTLTGGEPLLFKDETIEAIRYLSENKIDCSVNSNLTTLSEEDAFRLREAGVQAVLTSLLSFKEETHDGITQRKGSYQKTLLGIENVLRAGIPLVVHMVVSRINEDEVYQTGKFVAGLGVKAFAATKVSPTLGVPGFSQLALSRESTGQSLLTLLELKEEFGLQTDILECYPLCLVGDAQKFENFARRNCSAGVTTIVVGANGNVRPCIHSDEADGNIFREGLKGSWEKMNLWRDGSLIPKTCQECQYLQKCTAGCRVEAQYFGNIAGMDPYATSPADVLVPPRVKPIIIPGGEKFGNWGLRINPDLRTRIEDFGGIVSGRSGSHLFLNKDSYELLQRLSGIRFSAEEISRIYNIPSEQVTRFFAHLFNNKVVIPNEERN